MRDHDHHTTRTLLAATLLLSLAIIGFVQFAEHVQYYEPCELCLRERLPWYLIIGLSLIGLVFPSRWVLDRHRRRLPGQRRAGLASFRGRAALVAGSGRMHQRVVGREERSTSLRAMMHAGRRRCSATQIAWKLFGLSMAAYNFLLSLASSG